MGEGPSPQTHISTLGLSIVAEKNGMPLTVGKAKDELARPRPNPITINHNRL